MPAPFPPGRLASSTTPVWDERCRWGVRESLLGCSRNPTDSPCNLTDSRHNPADSARNLGDSPRDPAAPAGIRGDVAIANNVPAGCSDATFIVLAADH